MVKICIGGWIVLGGAGFCLLLRSWVDTYRQWREGCDMGLPGGGEMVVVLIVVIVLISAALFGLAIVLPR